MRTADFDFHLPEDLIALRPSEKRDNSKLLVLHRDGSIEHRRFFDIAEYLNEPFPRAGLYPADPVQRAHCRAISGEMHSGFANLRSALPMNLKAHYPGFKVWAGAQADIDRVTEIWRDCLQRYGGPYLFGKTLTMADAMYAPVCLRFATYDVPLDAQSQAYCKAISAWPALQRWIEAAKAEPDDMEELDAEF